MDENYFPPRLSGFFVFLLSCGIFLSSIIIFFFKPDPQRTSPPPLLWQTYTDAYYGYQIRYPQDWTVSEENGQNQGLVFFAPEGTDPAADLNAANGNIYITSESQYWVTPSTAPADIRQRLNAFMDACSLETPTSCDQKNRDVFNFEKEITVAGLPAFQTYGGCCMDVGRHVFMYSGQNSYRFTLYHLGSNDQKLNNEDIFSQMLESFSLLDSDLYWKTYSSSEYGFQTRYYFGSPPTETAGTNEVGQFTYLDKVDFGTNPLKSRFGYSVEISQKSLGNFRGELIGHITDKIEWEDTETVDGIVWTRLRYPVFLTTDNVPVTSAFTRHNGKSFIITSSSEDIGRILSTFKFISPTPTPTLRWMNFHSSVSNFNVILPSSWVILSDTPVILQVSNSSFDPDLSNSATPDKDQVILTFGLTHAALENYSSQLNKYISTEGVPVVSQGRYLDPSGSFGFTSLYRQNDKNISEFETVINQIISFNLYGK